MKNLLYITFLVCTFSLAAQPRYTLNQCKEMALENNVAMRNAANSVAASEEANKENFTKYFPSISATGMGYVANKGLVEMGEGDDKISMLKDGIMGGIMLAQPVFAGGQIVNSNRLSKVGVEASQLQYSLSRDEVLLTVEQYYWQLVSLYEKLVTVETIESMLEQLCKDVELMVEAGLNTRNDLLQVQLKQGDAKSSHLNLENNISVCRKLLAQYIGAESEEIELYNPVDINQVPDFPSHLYLEPSNALPQTTEYQLLESNVKVSRLNHKLAVGKNLPTVTVGAGYMFDNLLDKTHSYGAAMVSVSVPITDWWGGAHSIKQRRLELANAENSLVDNAQLLEISMYKSWTDLNNTYQQMLIAHQSIEQANENLRLNQDYFRAGLTQMSDLLDAQAYFQQTRDKYVESYAQFRIKIMEYKKATGQSLFD